MNSSDTPGAQPRFWGFISYAHADRAWADWLHRALETYRPPREINGRSGAGRELPRRLAPVFLDRADLAASDDMAGHIGEALQSAAALIVICSPASARSVRVADEIERFRAARNGGRVLALIVSGRPNAAQRDGDPDEECLPPPLRRDIAPDAREGLAADVRSGKGSRREALIKLVAGILDVELDVLRRRDQQRQQRRWLAIMAATFAGMAVTTTLAVYAWQARAEALRAEARARVEADTAHQVTDFLVDTFDVVRPRDRDGNRVLARELLDNAARELRTGLAEQPAVRARMLETIGRVYRQLGLQSEARPLLTESLELRKATPGTEAYELASALHQVAALEFAADHTDTAEQAARGALDALANSTESRSRALRAEVLSALANFYITRSRFPEADAAAAEALAITSSTFGAHSAEAAETRLIVGRSFREQGDYVRATQAVEAALADLNALYKGNHVDIAQTKRELAIIYQERGDFKTYDRVAKESLDVAEKLYGPDSPNISSFVEIVANAAYTSGRMEEAINGTRRVLALRTAALGDMHTRTGYAHYNLGFILGSNQRYAEAMQHLVEAQRIWEASLGPKHPDVAYSLDAQAKVLRMQRQLRAAEPLVRRALAINEAAFGPDHPNTARSVLNLANWMRDSGRIEESRALYDRAEKIRTTAFGADSAYVDEVRKERAQMGAAPTP